VGNFPRKGTTRRTRKGVAKKRNTPFGRGGTKKGPAMPKELRFHAAIPPSKIRALIRGEGGTKKKGKDSVVERQLGLRPARGIADVGGLKKTTWGENGRELDLTRKRNKLDDPRRTTARPVLVRSCGGDRQKKKKPAQTRGKGPPQAPLQSRVNNQQY